MPSESSSSSSSKKQRPAPGSMYFPPPAVSALSPTSATSTSTTMSPRVAGSGGGADAPASPFAGGPSAATTSRALTPNKQLGELLRALEPRFCLHPAVEELLLDMAGEFVRDVVGFAGRLAKHRRSNVLEARDLQFCLAKNYGISLAGVLPGGAASATGAATGTAAAASLLQPLGQDQLLRARPAKNSLHMHRLALKRKALLRTKTKLKAASAGARKVLDGAAVRKHVRKVSSAMDAK